MKAYVTDTHPLIWFFSKPQKLSRKVAKIFRECEEGQGMIYVPTPVLWEISLLFRAGKINLKMPIKEWYQKLSEYKTFVVMPLEPEVVIEYHDITLSENSDPFDRIIVASALSLDCPLITADGSIHDSKVVEVVW